MDPITSIIVNLIIGLILAGASALIQQALKGPEPGIKTSLQIGGDLPLSFLVGTVGVAGKLDYANTWGNVGGTPNAYMTQVISFGDLPVAGYTGRLWVNGELSTLDGLATAATQGRPVPERKVGTADHLWWRWRNGTDTTADSFLTGTFGSHPDRPWLSDMIGRGVPHMIMTVLTNRELWQGVPSYVFELRGIPLYDPRKDTTAGGSGSQRVDTPSTWAFSDNPIVIVYNLLLGIRYAGQWVYGMQEEITPAQLPYAVWSAAMNACDEEVTLVAGGTEKRFRAGTDISCDADCIDVIMQLLAACNGRITETAGIYTVIVGAPGMPVGTFADRDIVITEGRTLDPFPKIGDAYNGAVGTYREPAQAWETKEAPGYFDAALLADDDGRPLHAALGLELVFSGTQVERIQQATVRDSRNWRKHVLVLGPDFGMYRPLDVLTWQSAANGYAAKDFFVTAAEETRYGNIVLGVVETDPADHDWDPDADEQGIDFAPMTPIRPVPQVVTGFFVEPDYVVDNDGVERRPAIRVSWDGSMPDVRAILLKVRLDDGDIPVWEGRPVSFSEGEALISANAILPDTDYEVQGEYEPFSARPTVPTGWYPVTTGPYKYGPADIGELETGNLAPNAVSEVYAAYYASSVVAAGGGVYTDLVAIDDVEVPASASGVVVSFATLCHHFGDDAVPEFKVTRTDYPSGSNAVDVFDGPGSFVFNANPNPFGSDLPYKKMGTSLTFNDEPAAGSYSYALTFRGHNGTFSWRSIDASHSSLVINLAKR